MSQGPTVTGCFLWDVDIGTERSCWKWILHLISYHASLLPPQAPTSLLSLPLTFFLSVVCPGSSFCSQHRPTPSPCYNLWTDGKRSLFFSFLFFLFSFALKAKIIDRHQLSPVPAGSRRVGGQPKPGQGAALPAKLSPAAKRERQGGSRRAAAGQARVHPALPGKKEPALCSPPGTAGLRLLSRSWE